MNVPAVSQAGSAGAPEIPLNMKMVQDHMAVQALVRSYQVR